MSSTNCREIETRLACFTDAAGASRTIVSHGLYDADGRIIATYYTDEGSVDALDTSAGTVTPGACALSRSIESCYVPDQYAYQWAWNGSGRLQRYDPLTQVWDDYGTTQVDGANIGGYALAMKNDTVEPTLFFQGGDGNLYKSSPDDPVGTFTLVGPTGLPGQPCFDFDPDGRLLIGDGKKVYELSQQTGANTFLGNLIDIRSGANLNASPGDWFFDPNGNWFMMARDNAGATYGVCTGTVLWQVDPGALEATRISPTCSPTSGTGATWLAAGRSLLSAGANVYEYNTYTDEWSLLTTGVASINDLAAQWVIPDPIPVTGQVEISPDGETCETVLYTYSVNPETLELECSLFEPPLSGQLDATCTTKPNPFISDPFSPTSGGEAGCDRCPDEVWQTGCSDAGSTLWRTSYDSAGNASTEYLYGTLSSPTTVAPPGYTALPCGVTQAADISIVPFCNDDTNITVYRRDEGGVVTWFDASGTITEPPNKTPGECPSTDPNVITSDAAICLAGEPSVRRVIEIYTPDADGLPELTNTQVIYFSSAGTVWDSGVDVTAEPDDWFFGDCIQTYERYERVKLCERDDRKLLLIDSGGAFSKLSLNTDAIDPLAIPVASAGAGTDLENFILYAIAGNSLLAVDVNSDTQLYTIPLFSNDGSPTTSSAASFYAPTGELWFYDYGPDALFAINVTTGEVSRVEGPYTGIAGSGSSLAINPVDNKVYVFGSAGRVYELDPTGANLAATLVYDSVSEANGATFDDSGTLYFGSGNGNDNNYGEVYAVPDFPNGEGYTVLGDWGPGVNSLAFYNVQAAKPSCFFRKFGVTESGDWEPLSDHWVADGTERTIVGEVGCCECDSSGSGGGDITVEVPPTHQCTTEVACIETETPAGRCPDFNNDTPVFQQDVFGGLLGNLTTSDPSGGAVANVLGAIQLTNAQAIQALEIAISVNCHITIVMDDDFQFYSFWHEQLVQSPAGSGTFLIVDVPDPCGFQMSPINDDDIQTAFLVKAFCFVEEPDQPPNIEYTSVEIIKKFLDGELIETRVLSPDAQTEYALPLDDNQTLYTGACRMPEPVVDPAPTETRTASFSSELTTGGANGTVPANTYAITVFNDSNDTIQVTVGGDAQIIPRRSSHNWFRDFETEDPFAAGAATVTALSGNLSPNERVIFNYKEIN